MPAEWLPSLSVLVNFLLVLARVSGVVALAPVPGWKRGPDAARVILALGLTVALLPVWQNLPKHNPTIGSVIGMVASEAFFGIYLGLSLSLLIEGFLLAAQIIGLQAGYSYASTIDPSSEADSSVLQVFAQLAASLLFFSFGLDREVIRTLATSLTTHPAGVWMGNWTQASAIIETSAGIWKTALRLALPILALLLMLDLALALLGRVQVQLQLITLAFPAKMLLALLMMSFAVGTWPMLFEQQVKEFLQQWSPAH